MKARLVATFAAAATLALTHTALAQAEPDAGAPGEPAAQSEAPNDPTAQAGAPAEQAPTPTARTEPSIPTAPAATEAAAPGGGGRDESDKKAKGKKDKRASKAQKHAIAETKAGVFGLKGRVFTELRWQRAERLVVGNDGVPSTRQVDSLDLELDSARLALLYQAPLEWLELELEVEIADPDQVELRDAYVLADWRPLSLQVGNFKEPTAKLELESAFDLPMADRGFVNSLLRGWLAIAGRSPGVQLALEDRDGIEPRLIVGVFQGSVLVEQVGAKRKLELVEEATMAALSPTARFELELWSLFDLGFFYQYRVGSPAPLQTAHYHLAGADLTVDEKLGRFGVRSWLDVHFGESWYRHADLPQGTTTWFVASRAVVAGRYGGVKDDMLYLELFATAGMLDPDLDVSGDWARELSGGLNAGFWDRARLTLEAYVNDTESNFPQAYFGGPRSPRLGLTTQVAVVF